MTDITVVAQPINPVAYFGTLACLLVAASGFLFAFTLPRGVARGITVGAICAALVGIVLIQVLG